VVSSSGLFGRLLCPKTSLLCTERLVKDFKMHYMSGLVFPFQSDESETKENAMSGSSIGARIRAMRELKEMNLEELTSRTGLEIEYLRALEEDGIAPALGPLLKVSRALGTRLGTFIDDSMSKDPLIMRGSDLKEELGPMRGTDKPASLRFFSLGKGKTDRHMEPFFVEIEPESESAEHFSSHEGEEFIVVVSGKLRVVYGNEAYSLGPGDSIYYNSVVPHSVSCESGEPARIYAVIYSP